MSAHSLIVLQHAACETPGIIADALKGCKLQTIRSYDGEPVPKELGRAAGLIVMGGPQSVYEKDKFPYLLDELHLIENALHNSKPVLGVCLGSQLLASVLGAPVTKGKQKEIGWHEVTLDFEARRDALFNHLPHAFMALHWHGDVFELPRSAVLLASSALTPHQAFRHGFHAYGLLFHMEMSRKQIAEMTVTFADELQAAGGDAQTLLNEADRHLKLLQEIGATVFERWATLL
ncbi:MAG: type 1 glutamine amidotransferase [Verrucomicrobia bacterium]|nr:type 1 glutamine amidotransferase [Verrucomicrobiota bacterium]